MNPTTIVAMLVLLEAGECSSFRCGPDTAYCVVADGCDNTWVRDPEHGEVLLYVDSAKR